jgi:hypothetical protein
MNLFTPRRAKLHIELITTMWQIGTHWRSRTLLCPGLHKCPLCRVERAKPHGYALANVWQAANRETGLVETGPDVLAQLANHRIALRPGARFTLTPRDNGRGWQVADAPPNDNPESASPELLPDSLETLYGLPFRIDADGEVQHPTIATEWLCLHHQVLTARAYQAIREGAHQ